MIETSHGPFWPSNLTTFFFIAAISSRIALRNLSLRFGSAVVLAILSLYDASMRPLILSMTCCIVIAHL